LPWNLIARRSSSLADGRGVDAGIVEPLRDGPSVRAERPGELADRLAGFVALDELVDDDDRLAKVERPTAFSRAERLAGVRTADGSAGPDGCECVRTRRQPRGSHTSPPKSACPLRCDRFGSRS